jgi:hypothetical protein
MAQESKRKKAEVSEPNLGRQAACGHGRLSPTEVGGFTCDDCGLYLFRKPGEPYRLFSQNR